MTRQIIKVEKAYRRGDGAARGQLQQLAYERKKLLIETLLEDPDGVLPAMLPGANRSVLQGLSLHCVEIPATVEGALEVRHTHFDNGLIRDDFTLTTAEGKKLKLHPTNVQTPSLLSGMRVKVKGLEIDSELLFDGTFGTERPNGDLGGISILATPGNPPVLGDQHTLVVLARFQDTPPPNPTRTMTEQLFFTDLNEFYQETSFHKISVSGQVLERTLPMNLNCERDRVEAAVIAAVDPEVDLRTYSRLFIVFPWLPCRMLALATLGKLPFQTDEGEVRLSVAYTYIKKEIDNRALLLTAHEMGHNFGNNHASLYDCGADTYRSTGCDVWEYGDVYDVMGGESPDQPWHFNAIHKEYVGWLSEDQVRIVTTSGREVIGPIETPVEEVKVLKIPRAVDDFLYLEYRQPIGYDADLVLDSSRSVFRGALLHISRGFPSRSYLLYPNPPVEPRGRGVALLPGQSFRDPSTNTVVKTVSQAASQLTLDITVDRTDFTPPTVAITVPTQDSVVAGVIQVTAAANDPSGIQRVDFYTRNRGGDYVFASDVLEPYEVTLDTRQMPNGSNRVFAQAFDGAGESTGTPGNSAYSPWVFFSVENTDVIPPTVRLLAPRDGEVFDAPLDRPLIPVAAEANDDVGIYQVTFHLDGRPDPVAWDVNHKNPYDGGQIRVEPGRHTLYAKAYDFVGNTVDSAVVSFIYRAGDFTPPTVALIAPTAGATVSGSVILTAEATDNLGIQQVEFLRDPDTSIGVAAKPPYAVAWDTTSVVDGKYALYAKAYDIVGNVAWSAALPVVVENTPPKPQFLRGDANQDGTVDISDAIITLRFLYLPELDPRTVPKCFDAMDADDNGMLNITDPMYLLQFLFRDGPMPPPPYPSAGPDPTEDQLPCDLPTGL
jgi:hypothetical protein